MSNPQAGPPNHPQGAQPFNPQAAPQFDPQAAPPPGPQFAPPVNPQEGAPPKKSKLPKIIIVAVVVLGAIGFGVYSYFNSSSSAKVGDCVTVEASGSSVTSEKKVDCAGPGAKYKVVGREENKAKADFDKVDTDPNATLCTGTSAPIEDIKILFLSKGKSGSTGTVLCLVDANAVKK